MSIFATRILFTLLILLSADSLFGEMMYVSILGQDEDALLERKDIKIEVEGKEAPIKEFFFVDTLHPKQRSLIHPAGRRQHVVVLDLILSKPDDIIKARTWMNDLASKAGKYDLFALAAITQQDGLRWFCHLTSDRNSLRAGWNAITREKPPGLVLGPDGNLYPAKFNSPSISLASEDTFRKNLDGMVVKTSTENDRFIVVQSLVDIAYLLSTVEGRKNVYLISPGFDAKGLSINLDLEKKSKQTAEKTGAKEPTTFDSVTNSFRDIEEVAKQGPGPRPRQIGVEVIPDLFAGTDSHVHAISPGSERNGFLDDLTFKTAGHYFIGTFDPSQIINADRFYYVAGYEEVDSDKILSSIRISAGDRKIQATEKWFVPKFFEEYSQAEKHAMVSEAIFKDYGKQTSNEHFWADFYFEEGLNKIPVFTQIEGAGILQSKADSHKLEVYGFVIDADQSIVDFRSSVVEMDLTNKNLRERIEKSGIKVWQILLGSTKPMQIRWVVLNSTTGAILTHSVVLDVKENEMTMTNPFVPSTDMQWIVWPKPTEKTTHRGVEIRYPYILDGGVFSPDLAPKIVSSDKNRVVYFKLYNLLPESPNPPVRFHLLDSQGKASEVKEFQLLRKPGSLERQGIELFWSVNAFPTVQPGEYRFRVDVKEPATGKSGIAAEFSPLQMKES